MLYAESSSTMLQNYVNQVSVQVSGACLSDANVIRKNPSKTTDRGIGARAISPGLYKVILTSSQPPSPDIIKCISGPRTDRHFPKARPHRN